MGIFLSQSSMFIIRYVAWVLGFLMNGIYEVLDMMGIANMALCITFFTIIIYVILTPIQIKQQKSSKVMSAIQPELQKIQKKYEGKKDTASQQKMQEETMALQARYGVSMTGSCLPMLIQLPILFALYQVILYIPGYVTKVGQMFEGLATKIASIDGYADIITNFVSENGVRVYGSGDYTVTHLIDFLYVLKPSQWTALQNISEFSGLKADMVTAAADSARFNSFLGINISDTPWDAIKAGFTAITSGNATAIVVVAMFAGILIPFLAWFTQWINLKLMPQQNTNGDDSMARQMNSMNTIMPLFSAFICLTFSMGIGIYWVVGAVVRMVQQVIINRHIGKLDIEEIRRNAEEKNQKKAEKSKDYVANITENARTNVKRIQNEKSSGKKDIDSTQFYKDADTLKPDSITAKANWVKAYDEKNSKKNGKSSSKQ